jgi:putative hemolysin
VPRRLSRRRIELPNPWGPIAAPLVRAAHALMGLPQIEAVLREAEGVKRSRGPGELFGRILGLRVETEAAWLRTIPREGPVVFVANHPTGGPDALAMCGIVEQVRPGTKVVMNRLLAAIDELRPHAIFVDPFGGAGSEVRNAPAMRDAVRHLRGGGSIAIFPAGEVAHWRWDRAWPTHAAVEGPWSPLVARLVAIAKATVVPLFAHGGNRLRFHLAGLLHPRLRTALLPRELLHARRRAVRVAIGSPIPWADLAAFESPQAMIEHLRIRTLLLRARPLEPTCLVNALDPLPPASSPPPRWRIRRQPDLPAVPPHPLSPASRLAAEIDSLGPEAVLLEHREWAVCCGPAAPLPRVLEEIGRLRERTFRSVGEGSGRPLDLDRFDAHYLHLFLWDRRRREILGAYRLGSSEAILRDHGIDGFYSRTLFDFGESLLEQLGPSLELGRSFVREEYQRHPAALMLLWKGIGRFVLRHPRHRRLFGPVSISREFQSTSRLLMMEFLEAAARSPGLGSLVRPRRPVRLQSVDGVDRRQLRQVAESLEEVESMIREIEAGRRSMPVLLRQYLKLDAKLLGFNLDSEFGDVVDALMAVDLAAVDRRLLSQYLGRDGAAAFLAHHHHAAAAASASTPLAQ